MERMANGEKSVEMSQLVEKMKNQVPSVVRQEGEVKPEEEVKSETEGKPESEGIPKQNELEQESKPEQQQESEQQEESKQETNSEQPEQQQEETKPEQQEESEQQEETKPEQQEESEQQDETKPEQQEESEQQDETKPEQPEQQQQESEPDDTDNRTVRIKDDEHLRSISPEAEVITLSDDVYGDSNLVAWDLSPFTHLKELVIGADCLLHVKEMVLEGFACLEKVEIGSGCFMMTGSGKFEISDCEALELVSIHNNTCVNWTSFTMKNCSVVEVNIGDGCFVHCENTVFEGACCDVFSLNRSPQPRHAHARTRCLPGRRDQDEHCGAEE